MASRPKKPKHRQKRVKTSSEASAPAVPYPKRLERETDAAYAALCTYLGAGPDRSTRSVFGPRARQAQEWSARYDWQARAAEWDSEVRASRLAAIQNRQREADLATAEADARLSAAAAAVLFSDDEPSDKGLGLLRDLWRIGRSGADSARVSAIQALVDLSGVRDLRKLRHHRATQPSPPPAATGPALADVAAALDDLATDAQLDVLADSPIVDDPPEEAADGRTV